MNVVALLVWLLILGCVVYAVYLVLDLLPLPRQLKLLAWLIVAVVFLLVLLSMLGALTLPRIVIQ